MATKFDLRMTVPAKLIGTIIELLDGEGVLVSLEPHKEKRPATVRHHSNGGNSGLDILMNFVKNHKTFTLGELQAAFVAGGFSPKSASPQLSIATKKGVCKRTSNGRYERSA